MVSIVVIQETWKSEQLLLLGKPKTVAISTKCLQHACKLLQETRICFLQLQVLPESPIALACLSM